MTKHKKTQVSGWTVFKKDLRNHFLAGILVIMPFGVTLLVMRWVFTWMAGILKPWLLKLLAHVISDPALQTSPPAYVSITTSIVSIVILLMFVYLFGFFAQRYLGKKLIFIGEWLLLKIPVLNTIYGATKQVVSAMSLPSKESFMSVVLVGFPRAETLSIGFLTGYSTNEKGEKFCKVFVPTTPNPTTGFFMIVRAEEVVKTDITVEDAFKTLISFGILMPDKPLLVKTDKIITPSENKS
jgi:uncharacterized membrane protein